MDNDILWMNKPFYFSVFGNQEKQYIDVIKQMLMSSLTDPNYEVRFSAVKASANYLLLNDKG
jgi:hypothetical protein